MFGLDALASIAGLIVPPVFDFIKRKFIKTDTATPQATLSALAEIKPEIMAQYVEAQAKLIESEVKYYNRDAAQTMSIWVSDLRACIRPVFTILSVGLVIYSTITGCVVDASFKALMDLTIASWFGSRLVT